MSEEDRQKLKEGKKNQLCSISQKELQQQIEKVIEKKKELLKGLKSKSGLPFKKEIIFEAKSRAHRQKHSLKNPTFFLLLKK